MITLQKRIGHEFAQTALLEMALTHKSYFNENKASSPGHNERLEFLGDAVLDLSLSHCLYEKFPQFREGDLSKFRASLVNEIMLAKIARDLELEKDLRLGKGEESTGGNLKPRLLASSLEALIGAYYLDAGFAKTNEWVLALFTEPIANSDHHRSFITDYKTRLQERVQDLHRQTPVYEISGEQGPDHDKRFKVEVFVEGNKIAEGEGKSKKQAEQVAAQKALEAIE